MALTTSPPPNEPAAIDMAAFGRDLTRRREALAQPEMPRNAGSRRTASKRALLAAIEKIGGNW